MINLRIMIIILALLALNKIVQAEDEKNELKTFSNISNFVEIEKGSVELYISKALAAQDAKEREMWYLKAIEKFPYHSIPAVALLHSEYVSRAIELGNSGEVEAASEFLNKARKLNKEFMIRIDETPDDIWKEIMIDYPNGPMTKDELKKSMRPIEGLEQMEKEWKKNNLTN